jgi:hypothetical protein
VKKAGVLVQGDDRFMLDFEHWSPYSVVKTYLKMKFFCHFGFHVWSLKEWHCLLPNVPKFLYPWLYPFPALWCSLSVEVPLAIYLGPCYRGEKNAGKTGNMVNMIANLLGKEYIANRLKAVSLGWEQQCHSKVLE